MEVNKNSIKMVKNRTLKRRKSKTRKGKCNANKKKVEASVESVLVAINNEAIASSSSSDVVPDSNVDVNIDSSAVSSAVENGGSESLRAVKKFKELPNKSAGKLSNSSFDLLEKSPSKLRKTITKTLGIRES